MALPLTPRQQRERDYYDRYTTVQGGSSEEVVLDPILGKERRPWNSYWRQFEVVQEHYRPGARLLDFGCGWGNVTVVFATMGYDVTGFDISPQNIAAARRVAEKYNVAERVHLSVQTAERLDYADAQFDVVAGVDILHHVDTAAAIQECHRVLKPGGIAVFREPLQSPVFDAIRNSRPVRRLFPNEASFDQHITEDERKLSHDDIAVIRRCFPDTRVEYSRVLSRAGALSHRLQVPMEKLDWHLRRLPGMRALSGYAVIVSRKG